MKRAFLFSFLAAALALAATPARADQDAVHFFNDINVTAGNSVHDAVCILCSVHVDGEVKGDLVAILGSIQVNGHADRDAVSILGGITVGDNASIDRDTVSILGPVRLGEHATIGRDMVTIMGSYHAAPSAGVGRENVIQPGIYLPLPGLVLIFILILIVREHRAHRRRQLLQDWYQAQPHP